MNDLEKAIAVLKDYQDITLERLHDSEETQHVDPATTNFLSGKVEGIKLCISYIKVLLDVSATKP
jgi:hypothetical protein